METGASAVCIATAYSQTQEKLSFARSWKITPQNDGDIFCMEKISMNLAEIFYLFRLARRLLLPGRFAPSHGHVPVAIRSTDVLFQGERSRACVKGRGMADQNLGVYPPSPHLSPALLRAAAL